MKTITLMTFQTFLFCGTYAHLKNVCVQFFFFFFNFINVNGHQNCWVTNILQNIFFYVPQMKKV